MRISKLNLESRGTFADLSYPTIILTNTNIIMLSLRRILESNKSASETKVKALPHVTISSTFHRRRWNIVDIVDDEPATRNDNVNDADVK